MTDQAKAIELLQKARDELNNIRMPDDKKADEIIAEINAFLAAQEQNAAPRGHSAAEGPKQGDTSAPASASLDQEMPEEPERFHVARSVETGKCLMQSHGSESLDINTWIRFRDYDRLRAHALSLEKQLAYAISKNQQEIEADRAITRALACADFEAELEKQQEGMVMVPREPTEEIIEAFANQVLKTFNQVTREEIIAGWKAALAASKEKT